MPNAHPSITLGHKSFFAEPPEVVRYGNRSRITVGRYSSIAKGVRFIIDAEHDPRRVTTAMDPAGYTSGTKGDITIGSDVWIGAFATVLSGVTIGDGAVVGAAAVVTRDVPPYAVVVGNPARVVKHRFDPATASALRAIRWWDWPDDRVTAAAGLIWSDRVAEFVARFAGQPAQPPAADLPVTAVPTPQAVPAPAVGTAAPPSACVVLVPVGGSVDHGCEEALRELERRGYPVWKYRGYSAVDAARNQMATDAIGRGFRELMWVDSDVVFDPNDVEKLRAHNLPFTCGLYPKKGPRQFACEFLPGTPAVRYGKNGGPVEIKYCGFGFTHVRAEVFETVQARLDLPICNLRFNSPLVPFFEPMVVPDPGGHWSLSEDYAFSERARQCGFTVVADTSIRLWHVGSYRYGWEDAGSSKERYGDYTFHLPPPSPAPPEEARRPPA